MPHAQLVVVVLVFFFAHFIIFFSSLLFEFVRFVPLPFVAAASHLCKLLNSVQLRERSSSWLLAMPGSGSKQGSEHQRTCQIECDDWKHLENNLFLVNNWIKGQTERERNILLCFSSCCINTN